MGRKRRLQGLTIKDGFLRHPWDIEHHVQTSGLVHGRHLGTGHPNDRHNTAYYGIAPSVFAALCRHWRGCKLVAPPEDYSFIDFGAGMGRALLLASEMAFREVIGVELNPQLAEIAQKNIALWQDTGRARCPTTILCEDAATFRFPTNPCVAYLFNPFRGPVLKALIRHMERSFASRPGQLDVMYANDEFDKLFTDSPRWTQLWHGQIPLSREDESADRTILNHQPDGEYASSVDEQCTIHRLAGKPPAKPAPADRPFPEAA